jgi:hypothetical protein
MSCTNFLYEEPYFWDIWWTLVLASAKVVVHGPLGERLIEICWVISEMEHADRRAQPPHHAFILHTYCKDHILRLFWKHHSLEGSYLFMLLIEHNWKKNLHFPKSATSQLFICNLLFCDYATHLWGRKVSKSDWRHVESKWRIHL